MLDFTNESLYKAVANDITRSVVSSGVVGDEEHLATCGHEIG